MNKNVQITAALDVDYQDAGPWRSYELSAEGSTMTDLMTTAHISEIDQDGGEMRTYPLIDARRSVYTSAVKVLAQVYKRTQEKIA